LIRRGFDRPFSIEDKGEFRRAEMEEQVRRLNAEYGLKLSEDEIKMIVQQAEAMERLLRPLNEIDLSDVMPILKLEKKKVQR
jgi:Asp-tRNA(Asn)/Glu-tRNA(Gln) amidotransferase C subunit